MINIILFFFLITSTSEAIVIDGGDVYCPPAHTALEMIVRIPDVGYVYCAEGQKTTLPSGIYYAYENLSLGIISAVDEHHPHCGERAANDLWGIVFPALLDGSSAYDDIIDLMNEDMHEACHLYWSDTTGW